MFITIMRRWILHMMLVGVLGMLAVSCSQEADDPIQTTDSRKAQVIFTIALDSPSVGSRGLWGDNYDEDTQNDYASNIGTDFDNDIDMGQFSVTLTLNDIEYVVQNITLMEKESNRYKFKGDVIVPINGTSTYSDTKIQVYANMSLAEKNNTFTTDYSGNPYTGVQYIPMWGVQTVSLSLTPGARTELTDPIYLLRAMAKVQVIMADNSYKIESIQLNGYNKKGYNLPTGWENATTTTDLDLEGVFCPSANDDGVLTNTSFKQSETEEGDCYTIYVPEYRNVSTTQTTATPATITVTVNGKDYTIEFKDYENGKPKADSDFNIVRNHWYVYRITKVNTGAELELVLNAQPWDVVSENIKFTDEVGIDDEHKMAWSGTYVVEHSTDKSILYIGGSTDYEKAAIATFKINTPVDATWYASFEGDKDAFYFLVPGTENDYDITSTDTSSDVEKTLYWKKSTSISGAVGENVELRIITAKDHVDEQKSVQLKIVVLTADGRTIVVNDQLMPDGVNADYYTLIQNLS